MKPLLVFVAGMLMSGNILLAQCDDYIVRGSQVFHANDIRTVINTGGDMFWDLSEARFQVPFENQNTPSAIFAAAVWIGGYDDVGNLKLAGQTYRNQYNQEYLPGPLTTVGIPFSTECSDWDTVWTIARHEIEAHILDFDEDGVIDRPQHAIYGWPGLGNAFFEQINGFAMPDYPQGYAPFHDIDLDGIYEPADGEYPQLTLIHGSIPDLMTWHVFNDAKMHGQSAGDLLRMEVQQTTFAFYCHDNEVLSRSIFVDFKLVNRATSIIDSLFFGLWMDPDLGCYTDDLIGSTPENNGFYVYNEDALDGTEGLDCTFGIPTYAWTPPVLSGSFVNRDMSSFMVQYRSATGQLPLPLVEATGSLQFYRLLTGSWLDGSPLCKGGYGYDAGPDCIPTKYAFSGNPNIDSTWSMYNSNLPASDFTCVASANIPWMNPGALRHVSMSFTLHLDPERDHLGNVELMYEQLPTIREHFSTEFMDCLRPASCLDDCVWPGDANNDGIANHYDILQLGLARGKFGPERNAPISWAPHHAEPWSETFENGLNVKFADMNGDGVVAYGSELDVLEVHYGSTHGDYQEVLTCTEGNALIVDGGFELYDPSSFLTTTRISLNTDAIDSLYGIAFTVLYDKAYFIRPIATLTESPFIIGSEFVNSLTPGVIEYAATRTDGINETSFEEPLLLRFLFIYNNIDQHPNQHDTTEVCIANIKGLLADGTEIPMGANKIQFIFLDENATAVSDLKSRGIAVYPNPSDGHMYFEVPSDLIGTQYELRQMSGQLYSSRLITNEITQLVLPAGIYVLNIRSQEKQFVEKVVVLE